MKIIEQKMEGKKGDPALCEDGLFVSDAFIAVIDGVTSKSDTPIYPTSGVRAKNAILEALATLPPAADLAETLEVLTARLAAEAEMCPECPAAAMVLYSKAHSEIWHIGDCCSLVDGEIYDTGKPIDALFASCRSALIEMLLAAGKTEAELQAHDTARDYLLPMLALQRNLENRTSFHGYAVLNGTSVPLSLVKIRKVAPGEEVVLASDGYPFLCPTLAKSEAMLEKVRKEDPLCYRRYPSTKGFAADATAFDDRTYIRFIV